MNKYLLEFIKLRNTQEIGTQVICELFLLLFASKIFSNKPLPSENMAVLFKVCRMRT